MIADRRRGESSCRRESVLTQFLFPLPSGFVSPGNSTDGGNVRGATLIATRSPTKSSAAPLLCPNYPLILGDEDQEIELLSRESGIDLLSRPRFSSSPVAGPDTTFDLVASDIAAT